MGKTLPRKARRVKPWFQHDCGLRNHPKILAAGPLAELLFLHSIEYANEYLTDGFVPAAATIGLCQGFNGTSPESCVAALVRVGLWSVAPGGWRIHDYHDYSRSKREVIALSKERSAIGRNGGFKGGGWQKRCNSNVIQRANGEQTASKKRAEEEIEEEEEKMELGGGRDLFGDLETSPPVPSLPVAETATGTLAEGGESKPKRKRRRITYSPEFEQCWVRYGRSPDKEEAFAAWKLLEPPATVDEVLVGIDKWKACRKWIEEPDKVPYFGKFLRRRQWESPAPARANNWEQEFVNKHRKEEAP